MALFFFARRLVPGLVVLLRATAVRAQSPRGAMATRADLEAAAAAAAQSGRSDEAAALRARLSEGDFAVGDRIVIQLRTDSVYSDTLVVRDGQVLRLPNLPDLPLRGVLRSELEPHLVRELSRYIREPQVEAHELIRLAVLGEVAHPGYYWTTPDLLVSDAIMSAGGPTATADVERSVIRRNGKELFHQKAARAAIAGGRTLDQLSLRAGDEIVVGRRHERNVATTIQAAALLLGVAVSIYGLTHR